MKFPLEERSADAIYSEELFMTTIVMPRKARKLGWFPT